MKPITQDFDLCVVHKSVTVKEEDVWVRLSACVIKVKFAPVPCQYIVLQHPQCYIGVYNLEPLQERARG